MKKREKQSDLIKEYLQVIRLLAKLRALFSKRFPTYVQVNQKPDPARPTLVFIFNQLKMRVKVQYGHQIAEELAKQEEAKP